MASHFETINKPFVQTNAKKATNFGLLMFTGRKKIIFKLNLQQNRKMHLA